MLIEWTGQAVSIVKRGTRNSLRNPMRLLLVVILLATSLVFAAAMLALNTSSQSRINTVSSQVGTDIIVTSFQRLTAQQIALAEHTPGVTHSEEYIYMRNCEVPSEPLQLPAHVTNTCFSQGPDFYTWEGFPPSTRLTARNAAALSIISGRAFSPAEKDANVVLMSGIMAQANALQPGSTFTYNGTRLTLIGLFTTGSIRNDLAVIMPLHTAERVLHTGPSYIIVYAQSGNKVAEVVASLRQKLGNQIVINSHADAYSDTLTSLNGIQRNSLNALLAALISATLIIVFTVLLTVRERTQEIGILKAIGASNWQVIGQFSVELLAISLLAALAAILLLLFAGPALSHLTGIAQNNGLTTSIGPQVVAITPQAILALPGYGILLAVVASIIPAWYIARLKPAQVLRSE